MSINTEGIGRQLAIVKDGDKKHKKLTFSISEDKKPDNNNFYQEYILETGTFQYITDSKKERDTIFVCGQAGSGKSFWVSQYIKTYIKQNLNYNIYFISEGDKSDDAAFSNIRQLKQIKLDNELLTDDLFWKEFNNCCVIMDDIDAISGKMGKYLYNLRDKLLKNSRKFNVSVIVTNHSCTGLDLKSVLQECTTIVFFMQNYNRQLKYLLENYVGLNKHGIKKLRKNKTRATVFVKSYPNTIIQEKNIMTLNNIQDF